MKRINKTACSILLLSVLLFSFVITLIMSGGVSSHASTSTRVIDDLRKDENFSVHNYPVDGKDYSISVIQIAESESGGLYIYTYQPCLNSRRLLATEINMSLSQDATGTKLYELEFVRADDVFCKYKVNDFMVGSSKIRYYNISTIYRTYDRYVDSDKSSDNKSIGYEVGQFWTACTTNNTVEYSMQTVDTITITNCFYGSIRVPAGFNWWYSNSRDMHIIAFSTDIKMDDLLEADVSFDYRTVDVGIYDHPDYGDWQSKTVTVTYKEKGSSDDHIFGVGSRTWDKIQTSSEFLNMLTSFEIDTSDIKDDIKKNEWVLAFYDTDYTFDRGGVFGWIGGITDLLGGNNTHFTQVSNATVIRLEFVKDGVTYNLGVVSDKTGDFDKIAGDDETFGDSIEDTFSELWDKVTDKLSFFGFPWWAWLLIAIAVIVVIVVVIKLIKRKGKSDDEREK